MQKETCLFFLNPHVPTHLAMELFFSAQHINILPLSHDTLLGNCPRNYNRWLHSQRTKKAAASWTHETGHEPQLGPGLSLKLCPFPPPPPPPFLLPWKCPWRVRTRPSVSFLQPSSPTPLYLEEHWTRSRWCFETLIDSGFSVVNPFAFANFLIILSACSSSLVPLFDFLSFQESILKSYTIQKCRCWKIVRSKKPKPEFNKTPKEIYELGSGTSPVTFFHFSAC